MSPYSGTGWGQLNSLAIVETRQSNAAFRCKCAMENHTRLAISSCDLQARFGIVNAKIGSDSDRAILVR